MEDQQRNKGGGSFSPAIVAGFFLWVLVAFLPACAQAANYGSGPYGGGDYNVGQATTTTALASSLNPSTYGASVTLTATVTSSGATGAMTFKDGGTTIGTATIGHGSGTLVISSLAVGSHSLTAVYGGATNYLTSTSSLLTQIVNRATSTVALVSSLNPSISGNSITLTATVTPSTATGTITFKDGSAAIGTATLGHASGSYTTTSLAVGSHSLTAVYGGNVNELSGTSAILAQVVTVVSSGGGSTTVDTSQGSGGGGGGGSRGATSVPTLRAQSTSSAASSPPGVGSASGFHDVPATAWYFSFVSALAQTGILSGYSDAMGNPLHLFRPGNPVSLAETLKMGLLAAGKSIPSDGVPKNRSALHDWSAPYVAAAEKFALPVLHAPTLVQRSAKRGEVIDTLLRLFGIPIHEATPGLYRDLPLSYPYANAIATATKLGLIQGDTDSKGKPTGAVRPNAPINRAEVSKILVKLMGEGR